MIVQTNDRSMMAEARPAPVGPFKDMLICLTLLAVLVVVPAVLASLIFTIGDFALQHIELPNFFVFRA